MKGELLELDIGPGELFLRLALFGASFLVKEDWGLAEKNTFQEFFSSPVDKNGSESRHLLAFSWKT
jgi:hypothetical protein